ncbi:MAG: 3,4-dihydroxy-2-butanone-4-phosphate synthase, partial [Deltaproteobacteria bacterium]|nr:3,4-dihydroxy-2-butanone-4-phosphate synthase [Deltaproteobacteria bacterium]
MAVCTTEEAIEQIRNGRTIILVDDAGEDSEGFLCAAAEKITPETINFMLHY